DCINNFAIDYLHNRPKGKPFFLFVSHIEPHNQNDHMNFEGPDGSKENAKITMYPVIWKEPAATGGSSTRIIWASAIVWTPTQAG
ncbi:MAG: hypothetical protein PUD16_06240, partial [bacterium]|nr:hypothetical protein [bacterium]